MISVLQLGTIDYATGLRLQEQLVALRKEGRIGDALLLLEHLPVITLGRNAKADNVIASPELLAQRGVEVFECNRGGDVTFHGPGQLVAYPIFDLRGFPSKSAHRNTMGVIEFVRSLEEVLIRTCGEFGIPTKRIPGLAGVWTSEGARPSTTSAVPVEDARLSERVRVRMGVHARPAESKTQQPSPDEEAKIAALGVHISRSVTSHGIALNVNTDLTCFNLIIPCGITSKPVTSIAKELNREVPMPDVAHVLTRNFGQVFSSQVLWLDSLDALLGNNLGIPMSPPENLRKHRGEDDTTWA
jgi:lipoyl(octanoyl) transferase